MIFAPQSIIIGLYNVLACERGSYEYYQNRSKPLCAALSAVALFISAVPGLFAGTGTHISFLSASFYDSKPGEYTSGKTLPETIAFIKICAEENGLNDLIYGVDEGRLLCGNSAGTDDNQLLSRTVGYTWQAAYDARIFSQMINAGGDYFSSWDFLSGGLFEGIPTVSYHVASNISRFFAPLSSIFASEPASPPLHAPPK